MNWEAIKDIEKEKPVNEGKYLWWSRFLGDIIVWYRGGNFYLIDGELAPVRYWKHYYKEKV